tara:strand:- start:161 stop:763 length:603 start_codon:yes stop_codon:yes gene_type:complete
MKKKLNIFSNNKINIFLSAALYQYELNFKKLQIEDLEEKNNQPNIIIIDNYNDFNLIQSRELKDNYLIISKLKNNKLNFNKHLKLLSTPVPINYIQNTIKNFVQNIKVYFHDISVDNEQLVNLENNSFCYMTKVEIEILKCIINEKETNKNFIKQNILNIKTNIETNSLESHLTRIRKKLNKINTDVKIQSKNEKLLITI